MLVSQVMSRKVATAESSTSFRDIWKLLVTRRINALPVIDAKKKLVGIITKEDLLKSLYPDYSAYEGNFANSRDLAEMEKHVEEVAGHTAKTVMSRRVVFVREMTPIMRALSRMIVRRVDQLPVLDAEDTLVGIICKTDIFRILFTKHLKHLKLIKGR